jgi:hypothetical protein
MLSLRRIDSEPDTAILVQAVAIPVQNEEIRRGDSTGSDDRRYNHLYAFALDQMNRKRPLMRPTAKCVISFHFL